MAFWQQDRRNALQSTSGIWNDAKKDMHPALPQPETEFRGNIPQRSGNSMPEAVSFLANACQNSD